MNVFNLISAGGGSGSGLYVWKKYGYNGYEISEEFTTSDKVLEENPTSPVAIYGGLSSFNSTTGKFTLTSSWKATTLSEGGSFSLNSSDYFGVGTTCNALVKRDSSMYPPKINYSTDGKITVSAYSSYYGYYFYSAKPTLAFIDYVISDDENAYPNGGTQGGYYYERYSPLSADLFNCTKCVMGSYTTTSTLSSIRVTHDLGAIPKVAYIWTDTVSGQVRRQAVAVNNANGYTFYGEYYGTGVSYTAYGSGMTASNTVFGFYSGNFFVSGATYNYIILA